MIVPINYIHVKNDPVLWRKALYHYYEILIKQQLVCILVLAAHIPNIIRYSSYFRHHLLFPQFIDRRVYHDSLHITHQLGLLIAVPHGKLVETPEQLYKPVIHHINGFLVPVYITKHNFQSIPPIVFINYPLEFVVINLTALYDLYYIIQNTALILVLKSF